MTDGRCTSGFETRVKNFPKRTGSVYANICLLKQRPLSHEFAQLSKRPCSWPWGRWTILKVRGVPWAFEDTNSPPRAASWPHYIPWIPARCVCTIPGCDVNGWPCQATRASCAVSRQHARMEFREEKYMYGRGLSVVWLLAVTFYMNDGVWASWGGFAISRVGSMPFCASWTVTSGSCRSTASRITEAVR
jgi:hypothetical protein